MGVWFGCALPDSFGDSAAEFRQARESVALIDKNYRAYLSFTGPDRVRYLNAVLTNDIKGLSAGRGNVSLLLNPQGHILAEIETYAFAEKLFCVSYAMIRERLVEVLDKFIIMDEATLTDETERFGTLALEGPKAAAVVREISGIDIGTLGELSSTDSAVGIVPCRIVKRSPGGVAGAESVVRLRLRRKADPARSGIAGQPHQLYEGLLHRAGDRGARAIARAGEPAARGAGVLRRLCAGSGHGADDGRQGSWIRDTRGESLGFCSGTGLRYGLRPTRGGRARRHIAMGEWHRNGDSAPDPKHLAHLLKTSG